MGRSVIASSPKNRTIKTYFDELCVNLMAIGMSYEQFWYDDPEIANYYIEANKIKQDIEYQKLWVMGKYVYDVIHETYPLLNGFADPKKVKPQPYNKVPYGVSNYMAYEQKQPEKKAQQMTEAQKSEKRKEWVMRMNLWVARNNKK